MDTQKFKILVDGIEKDAEVLKVIELDDRKYAIYSVPTNDDSSDILASEIVQDEEGYDMLQDIEDMSVKQNLFEIVNIMFS